MDLGAGVETRAPTSLIGKAESERRRQSLPPGMHRIAKNNLHFTVVTTNNK